MDKNQVIREIKRIALANGGKAPGVQVFERETGIKRWDWYPDLWLRWGEALEEAGYPSNQLQSRIEDQVVIERYISLVRELRRFPVIGEIRRKAKTDKSFPSHRLFDRFGGKEKLIARVVTYCGENPGFDDILVLHDQREGFVGGWRYKGRALRAEGSNGIRLPDEVWASLQDWPHQVSRTPRKRTRD